MNQALLQMNTDVSDQQSYQKHLDRLWYSVQSFLVASGNISKLLFGVNTQAYKQRAELRRTLGIDDSSPFHFSKREARNYFEHFDNQLETWFNASTRHNFVDSNVGPLQMFGGVDEHDFIRNFDPEKTAITFYGDECLMMPIVDAANQLCEKIKSEAEKNRRPIPH